MNETVYDSEADTLICERLGLNNNINYVLTHNPLNTYMVLIFNDSNKAQIYIMPNIDSPHDWIEIVMRFN